jgi:hypothetical protein
MRDYSPSPGCRQHIVGPRQLRLSQTIAARIVFKALSIAIGVTNMLVAPQYDISFSLRNQISYSWISQGRYFLSEYLLYSLAFQSLIHHVFPSLIRLCGIHLLVVL